MATLQTTLVGVSKKKIKRIDAVKALIDDPRTKGICGCKEGFVFGGKIYPGLTKRLKTIFHPESKVERKASSDPGSSIKNGTRVHRLLYHHYHCNQSEYCDCGLLHADQKNPFVENAKKLIESEKLTVVDCEIPIYSASASLCTCLDMIGYRNKGSVAEKSVIISIKTGYGSGYDRDAKGWKMHAPFKDIKSSSKQHNQLQGFAEYNILKRDYNLCFDEYLILYLSKDESNCRVEISESWWRSKPTEDDFFARMKVTDQKVQVKSGKSIE
jgi:hypothetical protein